MRRTKLFAALVLLCIVFTGGSISAQDSETTFDFESKEQTIARLTTNLDSLETFGTLRSLFYVYINDDVTKALETLERQLEIAFANGSTREIAYTYIDLGATYTRIGNFRQAFENFELANEYVEITNYGDIDALISFYTGIAYLELELVDVAIPFFEFARNNFESERNIWLATYELTRAQLKADNQNRVDELIPILELTIPTSEKGYEYRNFLYGSLALSELYANSGNYKEAKTLLYSLLPYLKHHNRNYYLGIANLTLAKLSAHYNDDEGAVKLASYAVEYFENLGDNAYILETLLVLTLAHERLGNEDKAFEYLSARRQRIGNLREQQLEAISQRILVQDTENAEIESSLEKSEQAERLLQILTYTLAVVVLIGLWVGLLLIRVSRSRKHAMNQLSNLNKDKNHFIGVVSHDLRSPLNSIMVLSEFLKDDAGDIDSDTQKEYGSLMFQATQQMQQLLNNMLDVNKIETNSTGIELSDIELGPVVRNSIDTISVIGKDKNINTSLEITEGLPKIRGNSNAINRILENLISNAYKFSPQNSTVSIKLNFDQSFVEIAVTDEGPGLTEVDKSKLFKKFEKLSASPTANEKSTGLGLYIVKNLVHQMNGTIVVESILGQGTTFKVLLNKA